MTTYSSYRTENFTITVACGKFNYISVSKNMPNNMRASLGRQFETIEQAASAYKSAEVKSELLKIELGLVNPESMFQA